MYIVAVNFPFFHWAVLVPNSWLHWFTNWVQRNCGGGERSCSFCTPSSCHCSQSFSSSTFWDQFKNIMVMLKCSPVTLYDKIYETDLTWIIMIWEVRNIHLWKIKAVSGEFSHSLIVRFLFSLEKHVWKIQTFSDGVLMRS